MSNDMITLTRNQQMHIETSRRYHLMMAQADDDLRELESNMTAMPLEEFDQRKRAIEELRSTLRAQWERER